MIKINRSNYQYKLKLKKEDEDKIPVLKKETIKKCKEITEKYSDIKTIIGVPSNDKEEFCFDVPKEEFDRINPEHKCFYYSLASYFYKNLYSVYIVPDVPIWNKKYKNPTHLLKVGYNDYGIVSIEETDIPVKKID